MKKLCSVFAAILIALGILPFRSGEVCCAEEPEISAKAAVLISADTGEIIYEHNSSKKLPMASTTKIMTTLLCLESGGLYEEFVVDSEAIRVEGSSMGLREGDIVTKYALCCGMLLPSGNDAANAAAVRIAGNIEDFAVMMNDRAREMGLSRTFFVTPSGLEGEGHGSSAYDMALLAREALKNEMFREICSQTSIQLEFGNPPYKRWLKNTNKLLTMCDGVYGVKTGFTDEAGRCLVSACSRDGMELICVTLNDRNDWEDHSRLYDYGFSCVRKTEIPLPDEFELDLAGADSDKLTVALKELPVTVTSAGIDTEKISFRVIAPPFVYAPVNCGDEAAQLEISFGGREIRRIPLYAKEDAGVKKHKSSPKKKNWFEKIISKVGGIFS
ncbi:MAG: D-alanyl-D-alanine carboxypeptidase [Ruminococcus sp.]|nr:D-alanyl-D-alanine carboxypeptidase [Ruminococcus sp.]